MVTTPAIPAHRPTVAVLACSDARVSPETALGLRPNELFTVRVAGAIASPETVASLTYAVEGLGVTEVVVLGHSHCGAVTAALATDTDAALAPLTRPIQTELAGSTCREIGCAVPLHVAGTVEQLRANAGPLGEAIRDGRAALRGAIVDIATGDVADVTTLVASAAGR